MPKTIQERTTGKSVQGIADEWEGMLEAALDIKWNGESCEFMAVQVFPNRCVQQELETRYAKAGFRLVWNQAGNGKQRTIDILRG